MTLSCPHCGFSRDLAPGTVPPGTNRVTCPRCRQAFPFAGPAQPLPAPTPAPPPLSAEEQPKAGFWVRAVGAVVDSVIVTAVTLVTAILLGAIPTLTGVHLSTDGQGMFAFVVWIFGMVLDVAYFVFFTGYCGQTPGKMAVRIRVIRTDGADIGYGRAFLREVPGKFLSGILLGIGYLVVAFDSQKQGLHDKIADTYVVKL
ncbi:MAG: hypothetical protein C0617_01600 [Desulfuromonas sp.]|uniref:RDD family protein n=1 Tax=Desulfuromonas sp. TaxID=892 RepID=UPI000CB37037|nr:RDD family protein [Desulfuromonas sp.]PLX86299.1 MAG: hypothetical protein C0617_01600 [Desulfuromonas sp.]